MNCREIPPESEFQVRSNERRTFLTVEFCSRYFKKFVKVCGNPLLQTPAYIAFPTALERLHASNAVLQDANVDSSVCIYSNGIQVVLREQSFKGGQGRTS